MDSKLSKCNLKMCRYMVKMDSKPLAVGLLFGVGMALTLKSWLLGIMFGIIFFVALNKSDKNKYSSSG